MTFPFGITVYWHPFQDDVEDDNGNLTPQWGSPVPVEGVAFDPSGSIEPFQVGRGAVVTSPRLFGPAGWGITARDHVTVNGRRFTVEGDPLPWINPFSGWSPGVEVRLKHVEG